MEALPRLRHLSQGGGYGLYECWASQRSWGTPRTSKMEVGHDLTAPYPQSKRVILHRLSRRSPPEAWSRIWNQHSTRGVHDTLCLGFCISVPQIASRHHRPESEATLSRPCREHAPLFYHVGRAKGPRLSPYQPSGGGDSGSNGGGGSGCDLHRATRRSCGPPVRPGRGAGGLPPRWG